MHTMNLLLLAGGLLTFLSLLAGVFSARLGLSFLLVFLVAGMLVGVDGPGGVRFDNTTLTAWVGNASLAIILLEGGVSTRMSTFRTGLRPALLLSTLGVAITAGVVGAVAMAVMDVDWRYGLLLGAIVASTDAAAVFSVLRYAGVRLNERVLASLEMESGLNDPMAVFLTLALIATIQGGAGLGDALVLLLRQAGFGAAVGLLAGTAVAWLLRRLTLTAGHGGLLSLIIVSGGLVVFAGAGLLEGSGFLAVYLFGVRLRARATAAAHAASSALDGFAWAAQAGMFLLLGLLVSPHQMLESIWPTVAVVATLVFVARPLAVWVCLSPLGFSSGQKLFMGWVGLRGAVPIVLALFPMIEHVAGSYRFFNVAFAVVLMSLLLQGTTIAWSAALFKVTEPLPEPAPDSKPLQGRLMLGADLSLDEVCRLLGLPVPAYAEATLGDWLTEALAKDPEQGDGLDWHGARFKVDRRDGDRIVRVGVTIGDGPAPRRVGAA
jgi:cell volume regulation protein A